MDEDAAVADDADFDESARFEDGPRDVEAFAQVSLAGQPVAEASLSRMSTRTWSNMTCEARPRLTRPNNSSTFLRRVGQRGRCTSASFREAVIDGCWACASLSADSGVESRSPHSMSIGNN